MRFNSLFILFVFSLSFSGCGAKVDPNGFFALDGTVKWNGQPIEEGWIVFRATDGIAKNVAAPIEGGSFSVKIQKGPKVVEITAERDVPGKFATGPNGEKVPARESFIPAKYNAKSELKADVAFPPESSLDFELAGM